MQYVFLHNCVECAFTESSGLTLGSTVCDETENRQVTGQDGTDNWFSPKEKTSWFLNVCVCVCVLETHILQ